MEPEQCSPLGSAVRFSGRSRPSRPGGFCATAFARMRAFADHHQETPAVDEERAPRFASSRVSLSARRGHGAGAVRMPVVSRMEVSRWPKAITRSRIKARCARRWTTCTVPTAPRSRVIVHNKASSEDVARAFVENPVPTERTGRRSCARTSRRVTVPELRHRTQHLAVERTEPVATYLAFHEDDVEHGSARRNGRRSSGRWASRRARSMIRRAQSESG